MIARRWHGMVAADRAEEYLALMRDVAVPDYRHTPGNLGAWSLSRPDGNVVHVEMLTLWEDIEAIRRFAGDEVERAKYYDFDDDYLLEKEPRALHFDAFGEAP